MHKYKPWTIFAKSSCIDVWYALKGTLTQLWKSANIFVFIWKYYVESFTLKHPLLSEICALKICEKFVYKHSETIEYVKS